MKKHKEKSFEDKLVGLQPNMMSFALTLTTNKDEAKDLLQETALRALNNREKYYDNQNFKGWIFTIMHNIFVNNYRRLVRTQTLIDQTDNLYHLNLPQDSGFETPEGAYTIREIANHIRNFTNDYRIPFALHFMGYKYDEIAQKMGVPVGTIKSRIFFARKRLQGLLKDYQYKDA